MLGFNGDITVGADEGSFRQPAELRLPGIDNNRHKAAGDFHLDVGFGLIPHFVAVNGDGNTLRCLVFAVQYPFIAGTG